MIRIGSLLDIQLSPRAIGHWLLKGNANKRQQPTYAGGFVNGREEVRSSNSQEAEAIREAQRGDANAFELLYRLHSARVFALCLRVLKNTAEAKDLTQETFLTVFCAFRTFRGHSAFSSWLHRVTMNCVLMHIRRNALARLPARLKGPSYSMTSMVANTERLRKSSLARRGLPTLNCNRARRRCRELLPRCQPSGIRHELHSIT